MTTECKYNQITGNEPTLNDCDKCEEKFEFPYNCCCLRECGEHNFCVNCNKGIYKESEAK